MVVCGVDLNIGIPFPLLINQIEREHALLAAVNHLWAVRGGILKCIRKLHCLLFRKLRACMLLWGSYKLLTEHHPVSSSSVCDLSQ